MKTISSTSTPITTLFSTEPSCLLTFEQSSLSTFDVSAGSYLSPPATGDFNNDTYLDLAITDSDSGNLYIFINNNNGTFEAPIIYVIGSNSSPWSVVAGDFDGDSRMDLAVANYGSNTIGIFIGNNNGTFQTQGTFSTGFINNPSLLVVDDFNNDTHLDLVVNGNFLGIMFGIGNGYFKDVAVLYDNDISYQTSVISGDLNNDNHVDLITCSSYDNVIYILLNNGYGYFNLWMNITLETFSSVSSLATGDFNNDNRLDLVIADWKKNHIGVFIQNKQRTFGNETIYSTGVYSEPDSITVGDFNNDGQVDLAVTLVTKSEVGIWFGIGNSTFLSPLMFSTGSGTSPDWIISNDFNGDDRLDFITIDDTNNRVIIFINTCKCCVQAILKK